MFWVGFFRMLLKGSFLKFLQQRGSFLTAFLWLFSPFREVSSGFFYKSAEEREKLVKAERKFIEDRVNKIIELKRKVCGDSDKGFVVINQKVR